MDYWSNKMTKLKMDVVQVEFESLPKNIFGCFLEIGTEMENGYLARKLICGYFCF